MFPVEPPSPQCQMTGGEVFPRKVLVPLFMQIMYYNDDQIGAALIFFNFCFPKRELTICFVLQWSGLNIMDLWPILKNFNR